MLTEERIQEIRREYPALQGRVYLDTATTGPFHRRIYQAARGIYDQRYYQGGDINAYKEWASRADATKQEVAPLLNAQPEEIAFTKNASEGMNYAASLIPFAPGDNVVVPGLSFPSNAYVFMNLEERGVKVRVIPGQEGQLPFQDLASAVDEKTRAISVCHVEFSSGFRHDIARIGAFCRERGLFFHVDATQSVGALQLDVKDSNIHMVSFSGYKWLGCPLGVGVFYCSREILEEAKPRHVGWFGVRDRFDMSELKLDLAETAGRFECGGLNFAGVFALGEAARLYFELDPAAVEERVLGLMDYMMEQLQGNGVDLVGPFPRANRSGILYAYFPDEEEIARSFQRNKIQVNLAKGKARISTHFYNTKDDIDRLVAAVREAREKK